MAKGGWRSIGRASGAQVGKIAVRCFICRGCGMQHKGRKPKQCQQCGRMDFTMFDSMDEHNRWKHLELMEQAGIISGLVRQVRFPLMAARADGLAVKVGEYVADFCYVENGQQVIEDRKGAMTDVAAIKLRWMEAMGLPVRVTTAKGSRK